MIVHIRNLAIAVAFAALAWVFVEGALTVRTTRAELAGTQVFLKAEFTDTRNALLEEMRYARVDLIRQIDAARGRLIAEIATARRDSTSLIDKHAAELTARADSQITELRGDIVRGTTPVLRSTVGLLDTYQAIPGEVRQDLRPWLDCRGNGSCWPAQITATIGATRATLGQVARSAPKVATSLERSAEASERATDATARAMGNVAELTRPMPRWVRYPLQILGPTSPIWVPLIFK